jgi:hypothetical protein
MHVQMEHGLAAVLVAVDHGAIALLGKTFRLGIARRRQHQLPEQVRVTGHRIIECGNRLLRNE